MSSTLDNQHVILDYVTYQRYFLIIKVMCSLQRMDNLKLENNWKKLLSLVLWRWAKKGCCLIQKRL